MGMFFSLLKIQLKSQLGLSAMKLSLRNDKKALLKGLAIGFILLFAAAEMLGIYSFAMYKLFQAGKYINLPEIILTISSVAAGLFVFFFGIFYILSTLFFAKDSELLSSLPIKPVNIFASTFSIVLLGECPFVLFTMLPSVVIYGIGTNQGVLYYILALLGMLLLPIVPLVISSLLSLILMSFIRKLKHRDLFVTIGSILFIVLIIGGQNLLISRIPENNAQGFLIKLLQDNKVLIDFIGRAFPPSVWFTNILSGTDVLINSVYLIGTTIIALVVVLFLASFIYQRGAQSQLETRKKNKTGKLTFNTSSPIIALFKNEWRILLRTPVYALNSLVSIIMGPLLMAMPLLGGNFTKDKDMVALMNLIQNSKTITALMLISAGIITLIAQINTGIATTFSREGKSFWLLKSIPVPPKSQVLAKLLAGYSASAIAVVTTGAMMTYAFKIEISTAILAMLISFAVLIPISIVSVMIDLIKPKLTWTNPVEAIKQNMNAVIALFIGAIIIGVFGGLSYLLIINKINIYLTFAIIIITAAVLSVLGYRLLSGIAEKCYKRIEG